VPGRISAPVFFVVEAHEQEAHARNSGRDTMTIRSQERTDARLVRDALAAALRAPAAAALGAPGAAASADRATRLDAVVAALIDKAAGGDLAAIKEVFDRVEGRPGQASANEPELPRAVVFGWKNEGFP
jgi:hypothetical protein